MELSDLGVSIGLKLVPLVGIGSSLVYKITARDLDLTVNLYIMLLEQKVHNICWSLYVKFNSLQKNIFNESITA